MTVQERSDWEKFLYRKKVTDFFEQTEVLAVKLVDIELPHLALTFAAAERQSVSKISRLIAALGIESSVDIIPLSAYLIKDNQAQVIATCSSTADHNGHDLRNVFQMPDYQVILNDADVVEVDFKNFAAPYNPDLTRRIKFVI